MAKPAIVVTEDEERMRLHPYTYIAGPMTGIPEFNYPEFNRVAKLLRDKGLLVINPAEMDGAVGTGQPWDFYLRRDIVLIAEKVGRVVLLSGWRDSHGATLERAVAEGLRCEIIHRSQFDEWYESL